MEDIHNLPFYRARIQLTSQIKMSILYSRFQILIMRLAHKKFLFASLVFLALLLFMKIANAGAATTIDPSGKVVIERRGEVLSKTSDDAKDTKDETTTQASSPSATKIETRQEPDRTRIDIYEGGAKLRLERKDGQTSIKLEDEKGEEMELPEGMEEEVLEIKERADKNQIKVRVAGNEFVVEKDKVSAATKLPLSVNLKTNELTVTTPAGEKTVTVLPDQAVKNMLVQNVIDQTGTAPEEAVKLTATREGVLAYEIPGTKKKRFLGFLPVSISKTAVVSAETGELLKTQQTLLSQVLDFLSF